MNPFKDFADLLFTCAFAPHVAVVESILRGFNEPDQWSPRDAQGNPVVQYFAKETPLDISLAYTNIAETDTTKAIRIVFWEPRNHPGTTVFMGNSSDGLSHAVFATSVDSPYTWINVRIYDDVQYPGCFLDYYSNFRRIERRLMACKDEQGWDVVQQGPVQPFENPAYYSRRPRKEQLTRAIIVEYLEELGIMITDDAFWQTDKPAYLLWQERPNSL